MTTLDIAKLKENALTSIRLGVEDFIRSQPPQEGEKREQEIARALSASRNLFAGVLLLLKYKIASLADDAEGAYKLIHNPPADFFPRPDGDGGVRWEPVGRFKPATIDVKGIQLRFKYLGIETDWALLERIQKNRNFLEHLHPTNPLGEIASMLADLFPLLQEFITNELEEDPAELLEESWPVMLKHHKVHAAIRKECEQQWSQAGVPPRMRRWLDRCYCPACFSDLLQPHSEDMEAGLRVESHDFRYKCHGCGQIDLIGPQMIWEMLQELDGSDQFSGQPSDFEECDCCHRHTFLTRDGCCQWCEHELENKHCRRCDAPLSQEDLRNGSYCGYCSNLRSKIMAE